MSNGVPNVLNHFYVFIKKLHLFSRLCFSHYNLPNIAEGRRLSSTLGTIFVLVHGTFAKNAAWTCPTSALCQSIVQNIPGEKLVDTFQWSGSNNHRAAVAVTDGYDISNRDTLLQQDLGLQKGCDLN